MSALSLRAASADAPSAPALSFEGRTLSYAELAASAGAVGAAIADRLPRGERIGLRASNEPRVVVLLHALIERGIPFVPLHPRLLPAEASALIAQAEISQTLDDDALAHAGSDGAPRETRTRSTDRTGSALNIAPPKADGLLAMLFTSGTTGAPRGALLSRRAFIAAARASEENLGWVGQDRWLLCLPVCHVGGLSILTRCLLARKHVVLFSRFDEQEVLASLGDERGPRAALLSVVPTMLHRLLEADRANVLARARAVLVGGAGCPAALLDECARRGVLALTTYGLTEACSQVTAQALRDPCRRELGSGAPLFGTAVSILDPSGRPLPAGEIGTIVVSSPSLMDGYWKGSPRSGPLDTGDLGSLDENGRLHVAARGTDLIISGGENIYPAEIEAVLLSLPAVAQAVVFGVDDDVWGQIVAAAVVVRPGFTADGLARDLAMRVSGHRRPRRLAVVDALPLTSTGKVDRARAAGLRTSPLAG